jgi:hypothetical protein
MYTTKYSYLRVRKFPTTVFSPFYLNFLQNKMGKYCLCKFASSQIIFRVVHNYVFYVFYGLLMAYRQGRNM